MVYIIRIKPAMHYIKSFKKALKMYQNMLENPHFLIWLKKQSTFLSNIHYVSQTLIFMRSRSQYVSKIVKNTLFKSFLEVLVCWIHYTKLFYRIFFQVRILHTFRTTTFFQQNQNMLFFNTKIFFFKKSNSKCIRGQEKLILNRFRHEATFFMMWWQQAHFFMVFQFFSTLACTALEVILCIIKA